MPSAEHFDSDVLVVGSGPTGATTALALATYGVNVHLVSKWNWLADTPRAHITNQRAVEVLRDLGIEEQVAAAATPWELMGDTTFATSLTGPEIARLRTWGTGDDRIGDYLQSSPCTMLDVPQNLMEPLLINTAAARGANVSFNTEYLQHEQDATGVTLTLRDRLTGNEYTQRVRYLVGADGAKSRIADEIGLELVGEVARAGTVYILFDADLSSYVAHRPSILHWIVNPAASFGEIGMATIRAIRPWNKWIMGWGFDITQGEPELGEEFIAQQIRTLVGVADLEFTLDRTMIWYVNQQYATSMHRGRVFSGGDATHRHPPSSGLGSNTCMGDAFNLAWKLAFVVKGFAGEALLESYSAERVPVGQQIVARANQSRKDYAPIRAAFAGTAVAGVPDAGPALTGIALMTSPGAAGIAAREAMYAALDLKNDEFNAEGVELNQRYESTAVRPEEGAVEEVWARDSQRYVQATTRPGAKMPHAWLIDAQGRRVSTLDITGHGMVSLVTGLSGQAWVEAVTDLDLPFVKPVVIGAPEAQDLYGNWFKVREMPEDGAILVRPDGFIAWRCTESGVNAETASKHLRDALSAVLSCDLSATESLSTAGVV